MIDHEHARRYTAESYIDPRSAIGFFPAYHHFMIPWHEHAFYEIAIVESGAGVHVGANGAEPFRRGTVVFVPPGAGHEYRSCVDMRVLNCFFRAELEELEFAWAFRDPGLGQLFSPTGIVAPGAERSIVVRHLDEPDLRRMLDALEAIRSTPLEHRTRAAELGHLLVALDCLAGGEPTRASDAPERQATSPLVAQAKDLLEHDLAYPWTLTELSSRLYVGPFHLARQFVRSLGVPPMHYLARWRAMRAAALLAATDEPIAAVGAAVGWPDPSQFSRRFRAVFGVSPRTYRRRIRDGHGSTLDPEGDVARAS